jgi:hypothetical protein
MAVGTEKSKQIARLPLLRWYGELFGRVLSAEGRRIMIVGYSFADEHINFTIA